MSKCKVAILGSGNIGTDLMYKIERSNELELTIVAGIDPNSENLRIAKERGYLTSTKSVDGLLEYSDEFDMVFDATSAKVHKYHSDKLTAIGKQVVDLTPAAIGPYVVPPVNLDQLKDELNVNLVTCGGQATIPMIHAIHRVSPVAYAEIVATISSNSAGPGTRANIDEFTQTTAKAIEVVGGAKKGKAIIILNPAEPPVIMRDTIHVTLEEEGKEEEILQSINDMVKEVQTYVPGYRMNTEPQMTGKNISVFIEVEGAGDFFPPYSGNLDIMTAAATQVANELAIKRRNVQEEVK
ncbi:acetaldehyde dehydrogenase (acetylating) [Aliibacillus thermotolerans]|uniref:Acetaldehyde dehydrogenase n=1 Tax=Aliibacillus thermotolerans TaxID=1834418 RepID=A0ABW0U6M4_9BACI|nr:acetaldehyde dehydrogenase (acetylating) [Aliibacillus thermotolerans]MDA3129599.1 acetaldehyde dehydrogenase (acetylating) [Aliibacillus thermotolerans]